MRKKGVQGTVKVEVIVSKKGDVVSARVVDSPHDALSHAALQSAKRWKFRPGRHAGVPVAVRMVIPIQFVLSPVAPSTSKP